MNYKLRLYYKGKSIRLNLSTSREYLSCKSLIQLVLRRVSKSGRRSNLMGNATYGLFERSAGVETLVPDSTNVLDLTDLVYSSNATFYHIREKHRIEINQPSLTESQKNKIKSYFTTRNKKLADYKQQLVNTVDKSFVEFIYYKKQTIITEERVLLLK